METGLYMVVFLGTFKRAKRKNPTLNVLANLKAHIQTNTGTFSGSDGFFNTVVMVMALQVYAQLQNC